MTRTQGRLTPQGVTFRARRHPAEVTRDRLLKHYEDYYSLMSPGECNAFSVVRDFLYAVAEEESE